MSMTRDFLLEIGLEEIPARFLPSTVEQLRTLAEQALQAAGLNYAKLDVYATPRRLALLIAALDEKTADVVTEVKGPSAAAGFDQNGQPTKALMGFCKGHGLAAGEIYRKEISGNAYLFATKKTVGKNTVELLPELIYALVNKLYFPKPMRWGYHAMRFVRPVRWLVVLFGGEIIPVELAQVKSDRISRGHRVLGSEQIVIAEPACYLEQMEKNYVICDQNRRLEMIRQQITQEAAKIGGTVADDPELLTEVVYLVEYPTALSGSFEQKYLAIPKELVITPMREHQRYFPVYAKDGSLLPRFITVRNGDNRYVDIVAAGNEKVLRARLADAEFFYEEDLKDRMVDKVEGLVNVVFHEKLGNMRSKVERMMQLSAYVGEQLGFSAAELAQTRRAAYLAKADLASRAVCEFTELQGIMGEYYAQAAGEDGVTAQAIREHYLPRFAGDALPQTKPGIAVSLGDKLDSLSGFFAIGMIPTGSQDPYALRRAATGCVQIILQHHLQVDLRRVMGYALRLSSAYIADFDSDKQEEIIQSLLSFFRQRLDTILSDQGINYDIINAVAMLQDGNLDTIRQKAVALHQYRLSQGFPLLLAGFNRAANLLRSAQDKGITTWQGLAVREQLFQDQQERQLWQHLQLVREQALSAVADRNYGKALQEVGSLTADINSFFEAVMVMDEDAAVRNNRLALLSQIIALTENIGDLSKIVAN